MFSLSLCGRGLGLGVMRILITGANGLLGYDIWQTLKNNHEIYGCSRSDRPSYIEEKNWLKFDITNQEQTYIKITRLNPDIIIHLAAVSNVDFCEKNPEIAYKINSVGTRNICLACQRFDTALCYVSTDYVFDGENTPKDGYKENDKQNPINIYGKSKYLGEFYVKHLLNKFYIVRTAWLFGKNRANFVSYVLEAIKNSTDINVVIDHIGSPTYTKDLSEAISFLIEKQAFGIYHITNSDSCSREEVVDEIFKILKKKTNIVKKTRKEFYFAPRPANSTLNNFFWRLQGFPEIRPWKEALREFLEIYNLPL